MKYIIENGINFIEFNTYREAEVFCGEHGIDTQNIYEENNREAIKL